MPDLNFSELSAETDKPPGPIPQHLLNNVDPKDDKQAALAEELKASAPKEQVACYWLVRFWKVTMIFTTPTMLFRSVGMTDLDQLDAVEAFELYQLEGL